MKCVAVAVPANGFLASSGRDWQCDWRYKKSGALCVTLEALGAIEAMVLRGRATERQEIDGIFEGRG